MSITPDYAYDAQICLAEAVNYAVEGCGMDADAFIDAMIVSGYARRYSMGYVDVVAGMSGIELAICAISEAGYDMDFPEMPCSFARHPAYWSGYIMACYMTARDVSVKYFHDRFSMQRLMMLYPVYHEMDEMKCIEHLDAVILPEDRETNLRKMRRRLHFTQEKLAQLSGVSKSAITQYERREKDIDKASFETLGKLAEALYCPVAALVEKSTDEEYND